MIDKTVKMYFYLKLDVLLQFFMVHQDSAYYVKSKSRENYH